MTPTIPIPTDNIYKFACLFGLALIVSAIFSFVATYTSSLDRKIKFSEAVITLEAKAQRSKVEEDTLTLNNKLIKVTNSNETAANAAIAIVLVGGMLLSLYGAGRWHSDIQQRDNLLVKLQIEKLKLEIAKLQAESSPTGMPSLEDSASSGDA